MQAGVILENRERRLQVSCNYLGQKFPGLKHEIQLSVAKMAETYVVHHSLPGRGHWLGGRSKGLNVATRWLEHREIFWNGRCNKTLLLLGSFVKLIILYYSALYVMQ